MRPGESEERRPGGGDAHLLAMAKANRFRAQLTVLLNRIGTPIPAGSHSDVIEDFHRRLAALGLHADVIEFLVDRRGEDCVPPWGSQICTNGNPCPEDARKEWWQASCAEIAATSPHRFRAGASMRYDAQFDVSGAA